MTPEIMALIEAVRNWRFGGGGDAGFKLVMAYDAYFASIGAVPVQAEDAPNPAGLTPKPAPSLRDLALAQLIERFDGLEAAHNTLTGVMNDNNGVIAKDFQILHDRIAAETADRQALASKLREVCAGDDAIFDDVVARLVALEKFYPEAATVRDQLDDFATRIKWLESALESRPAPALDTETARRITHVIRAEVMLHADGGGITDDWEGYIADAADDETEGDEYSVRYILTGETEPAEGEVGA
jgi:hypothetical protein